MKVNTLIVAIIVLVMVFGVIALASVLGFWNTVSTKEPKRYSIGEEAGEYNPADIKGSYTFGEISELFEIPLEDLGHAFALKDESKFKAFQCKELEEIYITSSAQDKEVGTDSVRIFVALYKSLPITLNYDTYFPKPAVNMLDSKANLTEDQTRYLENHTIIPLNAEATTESSESTSTDRTIKGSTTFKELLDWGVKKEDIERIIDDKIPNTEKTLKDYATTKGIEFSTFKEQIQKLIDSQN